MIRLSRRCFSSRSTDLLEIDATRASLGMQAVQTLRRFQQDPQSVRALARGATAALERLTPAGRVNLLGIAALTGVFDTDLFKRAFDGAFLRSL